MSRPTFIETEVIITGEEDRFPKNKVTNELKLDPSFRKKNSKATPAEAPNALNQSSDSSS